MGAGWVWPARGAPSQPAPPNRRSEGRSRPRGRCPMSGAEAVLARRLVAGVGAAWREAARSGASWPCCAGRCSAAPPPPPPCPPVSTAGTPHPEPPDPGPCPLVSPAPRSPCPAWSRGRPSRLQVSPRRFPSSISSRATRAAGRMITSPTGKPACRSRPSAAASLQVQLPPGRPLSAVGSAACRA